MAKGDSPVDFYSAWLAAHEGGNILDAAPTGPVAANEGASGEVVLPIHDLNGQS